MAAKTQAERIDAARVRRRRGPRRRDFEAPVPAGAGITLEEANARVQRVLDELAECEPLDRQLVRQLLAHILQSAVPAILRGAFVNAAEAFEAATNRLPGGEG